jgi:eukaryotic-like serine/threonine-protein kinase
MSDLLLQLQRTLGDRYTIEREIGHGGMALVYLAQDRKHQRRVAIKVLRPDLARAIGPERFLREIEIAARLSHPHILPLYDSGATERLAYYVMPMVEGQSLRDRITAERQLPLQEAIRITGQIADALGHAHANGVVHRDVKPENILLTGGEALVADFGIARAADSAGERLTETGIAVGTPAYMSPEQAAGETTIDGRADVYALGCVVYEMLAGQPPFTGSSSQAVLARHALDPVPPLRTIRPDLPQGVDRAVLKALAKAPADRFDSTAAFKAALVASATEHPRRRLASRGVLGGLAVLGAVIVAIAVSTRGGERESVAQAIAVLRFDNIGGNSKDEYFSDGMSEELMTALARIPGLRVTPRTSAFSFKDKAATAPEIGRALQVQWLLEGAVRHSAGRIRVTTRLVLAAKDSQAWSNEYERDARDVFAVQDEIAHAVVDTLRVRLSGGTGTALVKRSTENTEAHDLYLQGRYFFAKRDSTSLRKAREYFEQAIGKDSSYALAYAGLSDAYSHASVFGYVSPHDIYLNAKAAALRALALDSTLVEVHTSLGFIALFLEWDWPTAARELDRALALDPNHPEAHLFHGWYFVATDRMNDAVDEVRTAVRLDPFSVVNNIRLAHMLFYARRYDDALSQSRRVIELDSMWFQGRVELARAYLQLGHCDEALATLKQMPEQTAPTYRGISGWISSRCGHRPEALAELNQFQAEARDGRYVSHYSLAVIHAGLGNRDRAFAELDSAYTERTWAMFTLRVDPAFDGLRSDPRFERLVKKVGQPS